MMKKSIFAIAVASALTLGAAQAETVLYGSLRYDYSNAKTTHGVAATPVHYYDSFGNPYIGAVQYRKSSTRLSDLADAGSRIGLKGSEDLGNGNAVIYNIEYGFDGMTADGKGFKTRKAVLGLTGDWGTFTAGRQDNPFNQVLIDDSIVDQFNGSSVITPAAQRAMTTTITGVGATNYTYSLGTLLPVESGLDPVVNGYIVNSPGRIGAVPSSTIADAAFSRVGKVIAYTTPNLGGFYANVALMMDKDLYPTNNQKTIDLWTVNAHYAHELSADGKIMLKAGYLNSKVTDRNSAKAWGLFAGYDQSAFGVTFSYAQGDHAAYAAGTANIIDPTTGSVIGNYTTDGPKNKSRGYDLGARFSFGANYFSTIRANYGENQVKTLGRKDKVKSWAVGFEQKLSTRTRAWVEYGVEETKYNNFPVKIKNDVISVGMRHDF